MIKNYFFNLSTLQVSALPTLHRCYIAAFTAIKSPRATSWSLDDTKALQGTSPNIIWKNEELWNNQSKTAKQAFYSTYNDAGTLPLLPGVREMLKRIKANGNNVFIFSMKHQHLILKELVGLGIAPFCDGYIGTKPDKSFCKETLLKTCKDYFCQESSAVVVASKSYYDAAKNAGLEFKEANSLTFRELK